MYTPAPDNEVDGLVGYVDQQLDAIRACALGLTENQARSRPCRSSLSIGGIIKHVNYVMEGAIARLSDGISGSRLEEGPDAAAYERHEASLVLAEDETTAAQLSRLDELRPTYLQLLGGADPEAASTEPSAPWFGILEPQPSKLRYALVHQVEELARHAGHADIIREEIDGQYVPGLMLTLAGVDAGDFFTPYVPAPGTIGAAP